MQILMTFKIMIEIDMKNLMIITELDIGIRRIDDKLSKNNAYIN